VKVRLLGIAAGGGVPQWNCACRNCHLARAGRLPPLTQSSLAFSPDGATWYLVNATPDVTTQLARWPELWPLGLRSSPIHGIVLTDGELDHILGLPHLREGAAWTLYATPSVAAMLEDDLRILPALRRYGPVEVRPLSLDAPLVLGTPPESVEVFATPISSRSPRYAGGASGGARDAVVALALANPTTGRRLVYAPCVGDLSPDLFRWCEGADIVLFDGTFWADDELPRLGVASETARAMGHVPVGGPFGSHGWLADLPARTKLYVHVNNTNPLLDPDSEERAAVRALGLDVAREGWTVTL
jgi:pyrroloquinoline quinone biosynthesis protein B